MNYERTTEKILANKWTKDMEHTVHNFQCAFYMNEAYYRKASISEDDK